MTNLVINPFLVIPPPEVLELTQVLSAASATASITQPVGIQAGDLIIFANLATNSPPPAATVPSGYTQLLTISNSASRVVLSYKIADGTEGGNNVTGMTTPGGVRGGIVVYRPNRSIVSVSGSDPALEITSGNPVSQTVNASVAIPPVIIIGLYWALSGAIDPRTMSPAKDGEVNAGTTFYLAWKLYASSPQDTSVDMDDEGFSNIVFSAYVEVT
jgi:hypothetical protein